MFFLNSHRKDYTSILIAKQVLLFLLLPLIGLMAGCLPAKTGALSGTVCEIPAALNASRISFFLSINRFSGLQVKLQLLSVEILRDELWFPVTIKPRTLDTQEIGDWQLLLGNRAFQPGEYSKVKLTFGSEAFLTLRGQTSVRTLEESVLEIPFPAPFSLQDRASESVFLVWDVDASFDDPAPGPLAFSLGTAKLSPITANQIYVAAPDINTIYSIRADKKWVDKSFYVAGRPTYIAIDDTSQKLYILCQEAGDIKIYDLITNALVDVIALPMTFRPKFMWVDDAVTRAYVLDDLGHLSVVDLQNRTVLIRTKIGQRPGYVNHIQPRSTIAVSSTKDNRVYLLDDQTLEIKDQIMVGSGPAGTLYKDNSLYITEEFSDRVAVFDFNIRNKIHSIPVGYAPYRLAAIDNNIYVANSGNGSMSMIRTHNHRVAREIPIGDQIYEMVVSEREQLLYVGKNVEEGCGGSISIIDITTSKVVGQIELGARPLGIAIGR